MESRERVCANCAHSDGSGYCVQYGGNVSPTDSCGDWSTDANVNHPSHYNKSSIECIEAIKAALTPEEFRGFCKGNALKYVWREQHKGGDEDLRKAEWYLRKMDDGE